MSRRIALKTARVVSNLFRPVYMPTLAFLALFSFTFLNLLPWPFKGAVLAVVYLSTAALPMLSIYTYRKLRGLTHFQLRSRERRAVPYLLSLMWYMVGLHLMGDMHLPRYMGGILMGAIMIQITCSFINIRWKISMHAAAVGGLTGVVMALSLLLFFDPTWWLCGCILLCGVVNTARMTLRQHTLMQVVAGTVVGAIGGFIGVVLG